MQSFVKDDYQKCMETSQESSNMPRSTETGYSELVGNINFLHIIEKLFVINYVDIDWLTIHFSLGCLIFSTFRCTGAVQKHLLSPISMSSV